MISMSACGVELAAVVLGQFGESAPHAMHHYGLRKVPLGGKISEVEFADEDLRRLLVTLILLSS